MSDLGPCIECAKSKQISLRKYTANRMMDVLKLIHTDICRPFSTTIRNDHVYFIIFIKSVRSDCDGEYYGHSDGLGEQHPGHFAKFLEEWYG
jgi:hypothetical protein